MGVAAVVLFLLLVLAEVVEPEVLELVQDIPYYSQHLILLQLELEVLEVQDGHLVQIQLLTQ